MKTSDDFSRELLSGTNLMSGALPLKEYADELLKLQANVCRIATGDKYWEGMRFDEAIYLIESFARINNLRSNENVHNGILAIKELQRETSITMSGVKAEGRISGTLRYLARPSTKIFANVYLNNGCEETEIDDIVLTDAGIMILEVKKASSDVTISPEGRLIKAGSECYDKIPLGENMARKRRLLKEELEKVLSDKGLNIPVTIDSRIVFSAPSGKHIYVDDQYRRERYCFRSNLNPILESYDGGCHYDDIQLAQLSELLSSMRTNVRASKGELDYEEVVSKIAKALEVLQMGSTPEAEPKATVTVVKFKEARQKTDKGRFFSALHAAAEVFRYELKGA